MTDHLKTDSLHVKDHLKPEQSVYTAQIFSNKTDCLRETDHLKKQIVFA
jgi:hypothetical protein